MSTLEPIYSEHNGPQSFIGIDQHRAGESGNHGCRQKVKKIGPPSGEPQFTIARGGIHPFQEHLNRDGAANANEGRSPSLFKTQERVAQDVPHDHQRREIPEGKKPQLGVFVGIEKDGSIEGRCFHIKGLVQIERRK
jgi:hypothetical protein